MTYENEDFELDVETVINRVTEVEFDESCRVRKDEKGMDLGLKMNHLDYFFAYMPMVENFDLTYLDTSNVESMEYMFLPTPLAANLNLADYTDTTDAFSILKSVFTGSNGTTTQEIIDMLKELFPASRLKSVTVPDSFAPGSNAPNAISMKGMFAGCGQMKTLDMSKWNLNNVYNYEAMFSLCTSLSGVKFPTNFKPATGSFNNVLESKLTMEGANFAAMFFGCPSLGLVDWSNADFSNVKDLTFTFGMCVGLTNVAFPYYDKNTNNFMPNALAYTFTYCMSLQTLDLTNVDTHAVAATLGEFSRSSNLTTIYVNKDRLS